MTKLLDANILIYAHGLTHPLRAPCQRILQATIANPDAYAINAEVLQELAYVYSRRGERQRAIRAVTEALNMFTHILPVTETDIQLMRNLMQQVQQVSPRDAIHAAVTINNRLEGIVSADMDFDTITSITRFDPVTEAALWTTGDDDQQ